MIDSVHLQSRNQSYSSPNNLIPTTNNNRSKIEEEKIIEKFNQVLHVENKIERIFKRYDSYADK